MSLSVLENFGLFSRQLKVSYRRSEWKKPPCKKLMKEPSKGIKIDQGNKVSYLTNKAYFKCNFL